MTINNNYNYARPPASPLRPCTDFNEIHFHRKLFSSTSAEIGWQAFLQSGDETNLVGNPFYYREMSLFQGMCISSNRWKWYVFLVKENFSKSCLRPFLKPWLREESWLIRTYDQWLFPETDLQLWSCRKLDRGQGLHGRSHWLQVPQRCQRRPLQVQIGLR